MDDVTDFITKPEEKKPKGSHILSLSTRAVITLMVVGTVCWMAATGKIIEEPLYTLVGMVVGYYFGQIEKPKNQLPKS